MKEQQIQLLEALATYKYLNSSQMLDMGISPNRSNLFQNIIKGIRDIKKPYIIRQRMPKNGGFAGLSDIYCLSKNGALWLEDELILDRDKIRLPVGRQTVTTRDYKHRVATINIHIALQKWLESLDEEMLLVSAYFDRPGSQRNGTPRILNKVEISEYKYLLPDLITHFSFGGGSKIIVWEQHNGKDTKKLLRQVETHLIALKKGLIGKKLGVDKLHRIGWVFEYESIMQASIKRLNDLYGHDDNLYKFFVFKTNEAVQSNFADNWLLWTGEITNITG